MTKLLMKYFVIIVTIYLLSLVFPTIQIGSNPALLIMGLVLLLVNLLLKPLLLLVTLPLSLLTLGLFTLIVNAWTIMLADYFVSNISMGGFLNALLAAVVIVCFNHLFAGQNKAACQR